VRIDEWLIVEINATKFDPVIGRCRLHRKRYLRASVERSACDRSWRGESFLFRSRHNFQSSGN
jgi:hypothetical protein